MKTSSAMPISRLIQMQKALKIRCSKVIKPSEFSSFQKKTKSKKRGSSGDICTQTYHTQKDINNEDIRIVHECLHCKGSKVVWV